MIKRRQVQNESTKDDAPISDVPRACADEAAAVEFMEKQRWGDHPCCPLCGSLSVYKMVDSTGTKRQANFRWRCHDCKKQYTVRVGTVFEDSRIPVRHWCLGFFRATTSKKGVSALEIHRQTGLSYKSALFMLHRIRLAMDAQDIEPLNGIVEIDEVFIGGKPRRFKGRKSIKREKAIVVGLKERGGRVRPRVVADVTAATLKSVIQANVKPGSRIMTDDWSGYRGLRKDGWSHESVTHSAPFFEYARGDVTTNSIEGFFGMLKRGLNGIYHSVSKKHLHRYLSEFEFRHDNSLMSDGQRMVKAIRAANHKHITYRQLVDGE